MILDLNGEIVRPGDKIYFSQGHGDIERGIFVQISRNIDSLETYETRFKLPSFILVDREQHFGLSPSLKLKLSGHWKSDGTHFHTTRIVKAIESNEDS